MYVQNCLNYGDVIVTKTNSFLYIGGIIGCSEYVNLTNCVSVGKLSSSNSGKRGSIVGFVSTKTNTTHCLWTSEAGCDKISGEGSPSQVATYSLVSMNATTADELNEYASNNGWNRWLLNTDTISVTFKINNNKEFSYSSDLILLPGIDIDAESESGIEFNGWYSGPYCNEPFTSTKITENTTLYGLYGKLISVSFDPNGGAVIPSSKRIVVNGTYGALPEPNRTGHSFLGWFTENNEGVTSETTVAIARNHILTAKWEEIPSSHAESSSSSAKISSNYVEIVFGTKNLTEDDVRGIIMKYTATDFEIIKFEDDNDGLKVVIKFSGVSEAESFVEAIKGPSTLGKIFIKHFYVFVEPDSPSTTTSPFLSFFQILL